jgi:hypothetical protein
MPSLTAPFIYTEPIQRISGVATFCRGDQSRIPAVIGR